jgi:hypothetical protein
MEERTMGSTDPAGDMPPGTQARAREGIEHLQAAARELIEAARAALDVAEEVVNDPDALTTLASTFATVGDVARRFTGTGGWPTAASGANASPADEGGPGGDDGPRVQRITVTG